MITTTTALLSLRPQAQWAMANEDYNTLQWLDTLQSKPTEQEVNAEIARLTAQAPLDACVASAKKLLAESDWSVLPDVHISNKAEFETYRAAVRALMFNPVAAPVFPAEPQPVWI